MFFETESVCTHDVAKACAFAKENPMTSSARVTNNQTRTSLLSLLVLPLLALAVSSGEAKAAARDACKYVKANKAKSAMTAAAALGQVLKLAAKVVPEPAKGYVEGVGKALCV